MVRLKKEDGQGKVGFAPEIMAKNLAASRLGKKAKL
jgi:hypothetical protein